MSESARRQRSAAEEPTRTRVVDILDGADGVVGALTSTTKQEILISLYEAPATTSQLADRLDISLQNAKYHIEGLEAVGLVAPVTTRRSTRGQEMRVYAPAQEHLVLVAGETTALEVAGETTDTA